MPSKAGPELLERFEQSEAVERLERFLLAIGQNVLSSRRVDEILMIFRR